MLLALFARTQGAKDKKPRQRRSPYKNPKLREKIKNQLLASNKGGRSGQWSARKAQQLAILYKKSGGEYRKGSTPQQKSLVAWTKQKWRTADGKPAIRGDVTVRYLPDKAWNKLTPQQIKATNRKKIEGSRQGRQFIPNTKKAAIAGRKIRSYIK